MVKGASKKRRKEVVRKDSAFLTVLTLPGFVVRAEDSRAKSRGFKSSFALHWI